MKNIVEVLLALLCSATVFGSEKRDDAFYQSRGVSFYASFDKSLNADYSAGRKTPMNPQWGKLYQLQGITYSDGKFARCATAKSLILSYAPENVFHPDYGAVSFWFKPKDGRISTIFKVKAKEWGVGPNSRLQTDLYHCTFLFGGSDMIRKGFFRALIRPELDAIEECVNLGELDRSKWYHFVWTWDNTKGMRGYLNGRKIFDNWGTVTWIQMMTPNYIQFRSMKAIDELYFFNKALTPDEMKGLFNGKLPDPTPNEKDYSIPKPLERDIAHDYGLDPLPFYPVCDSSKETTFTAVNYEKALDGKRPMLFCLDGNRVSCWPTSHIEIENTDKLDIFYKPGTTANYFRVISDGPRFSVAKDADSKPFWRDEVRPEKDGWGRKLVRRFYSVKPIRFEKLTLDRKGARIGEFYVYNVERRKFSVANDTPIHFSLSRVEDIRSFPWEGRAYHAYHNRPSPAILASKDNADSSNTVLKYKPLIPFHIITAKFAEQTGVAGVSLSLACSPPKNKLEDIVRLRIVDPVTKERDLINTEFKLRFDPKKTGSRTFKLNFDMRDVVVNKGRRLWIWLVSRHGGTLNLANSAMTVHSVPVAEAAKQMVPDTLRLVKHTYMMSSEGHIWSRSWKWPGEERYYYAWSEWAGLLNLVREKLAPENKIIGTYWRMIKPRTHWLYEKHVDYGKNRAIRALKHKHITAPKTWANPARAPQWALYQNELIKVYLRIATWWHDNRLVDETGVLGGYGDDTQFTGDSYWIYFATGDKKLLHTLRSVSDGTWKYAGFYKGFPSRINDVGHDAEEVVGAWPLMMLADYGNPRYAEMTMKTMSLMDFFTTRTKRGHLHFKSWYMSATALITDGDKGVDNLANAQFAILGHMLAWYNKNPKLVAFYRDWCDAWIDDMNRATEMKIKGPISVRMPEDTPIPHVPAMSSQTMQHTFFITGLLTGDEKFINRALNNDDDRFFHYRGKHGLGMLLYDFAFRRHLLLDDARLKKSNYVRNPAKFAKYFLTKDKNILEAAYKKNLQAYYNGLEYLYTEGQPSLDRLWGLFNPMLYLAILGGQPSGHRASSNWPGLAISFIDAGTDFASLVLVNKEDRLSVLLFNFNKQRENGDLRLWQLQPGEYEVTAGPDENGDDKADEITYRERVKVRRGSKLTIPVNHGKLMAVDLRQLKRAAEPELMPDLAISRRDVFYNDRLKQLEVTVHNIGSKSIGPFTVSVSDGKGETLAAKTVERLSAPVDLNPRRVVVAFPMSPATVEKLKKVSLRGPRDQLEITYVNNSCDY